jgi:hypothetical protein
VYLSLSSSFVAERYPITASNQTYILLLSISLIKRSSEIPSLGISIPQFISLVIALGFNP